jgi:hypothetical protein
MADQRHDLIARLTTDSIDMGTYDMAMPADRDPTYTPDRPACPCCDRRVSPLDDDGRCGHCGTNRARSHVGDEPCNLGRPTYTPDPADVELVADALARIHCWDGLAELEATAPAGAEPERADARAVLAALAAAGRLPGEPSDPRPATMLRRVDFDTAAELDALSPDPVRWCACKPGTTCGYHLANPIEESA